MLGGRTFILSPAPAELVIDQTQGDAEIVNGGYRYLALIVWDVQALQLATKQAHWHPRGDNFIAVHRLLDTTAKHFRGYAVSQTRI